MAWLYPDQPCDRAHAERFDAVLARNIEAQQRAGAAADDVTQKAEESRERVEAAVGEFKARTNRRLQSRDQTLEKLLARDL